uniref:Pb-reticulocyte binding protein n=1 Tax=Strongyloides papillosus TaxID=174720 RepID=A0A0N5CDP7_STREA
METSKRKLNGDFCEKPTSDIDPYGILREFLIFPDDDASIKQEEDVFNEEMMDEGVGSGGSSKVNANYDSSTLSENNDQTDITDKESLDKGEKLKVNERKIFCTFNEQLATQGDSEAFMNARLKGESRRQLAAKSSPEEKQLQHEEAWKEDINDLYNLLEEEAENKLRGSCNSLKNTILDVDERVMKRNKYIRRNLTKRQVKISCEFFLLDVIKRCFNDYIIGHRIQNDDLLVKFYRYDNRMLALRNTLRSHTYFGKLITLIYNTRLIYGKIIPIPYLNDYIRNFVHSTCPHFVIGRTKKIARHYIRNYSWMYEEYNRMRKNNKTNIIESEGITDTDE